MSTDLYTKGMKHKVFDNSTKAKVWAEKYITGGELGKWHIYCQNCLIGENELKKKKIKTNIRVKFDSDGRIDRFSIIDEKSGEILRDP